MSCVISVQCVDETFPLIIVSRVKATDLFAAGVIITKISFQIFKMPLIGFII